MFIKSETVNRLITSITSTQSDLTIKRIEDFSIIYSKMSIENKYTPYSDMWSKKFLYYMKLENKSYLTLFKSNFVDYDYLIDTIFSVLFEYVYTFTNFKEVYCLSKNQFSVNRLDNKYEKVPTKEFTVSKMVSNGLVINKFGTDLEEIRFLRNQIVHAYQDYPASRDFRIIEFVIKVCRFKNKYSSKIEELCNDLLKNDCKKLESFSKRG